MKKKKTYNILIAVLAVVVVGCGVMAAGTFNGWFGGSDADVTEISEKAEVTENAEATDDADAVENDEATEESDAAGNDENAEGNADNSGTGTCTICIKCSNILKNMDNLKSGKEKYVPSNGVILSTSTIEFRNGETVYDILKRSASAAGIPVSARKTSMGVYVEGINGLFEFDCGGASGWKYSVNGNTPGHACSAHKVKNGDSIIWYYTCGN